MKTQSMIQLASVCAGISLMTATHAQGAYNPETTDEQYGNRVITSIRTASSFMQPEGIPNDPLCLTVLGNGEIVPGSQVQYAQCQSESEITLSNTQRWVISYPPADSGSSQDVHNGTIQILFTGAGGLDGKGRIGCSTGLYDGVSAQTGASVPLTVEDCAQLENQIWVTSGPERLMLAALKDGQAVCMTVDQDSVGARGGNDGDWWKAVSMEACDPDGAGVVAHGQGERSLHENEAGGH